MLNTLFRKRNRGLLKLAFLVLCGGVLFALTSFTTAFFCIVFLAFLLFKLDPKYAGQAALVCLVCIPPLMALQKEAQAEQIAVYAFFLLVITVALQVVELQRLK